MLLGLPVDRSSVRDGQASGVGIHRKHLSDNPPASASGVTGVSFYATPGVARRGYLEPKASLRPSVTAGTVLFRGAIHPDRPVQGIAYAYKAGCPAAPYPVRGSYANRDTLTLRGAGPMRRGCEVVGYSDRSPQAVLRFTYLLDD